LGTSLFAQGVVKHLLTQGDVFLISYLASLQAQGIYALASNYGGLIARVVFQPIEETGRNYFSKLLSSIDGKPSETEIRSASKDLHSLLRFYVLLSIVAVSLGPTVAPVLLKLVAGSGWTSTGAGSVLAKYCYYIPLLAVNGITEAFVSSVATQSELNNQSGWMFAFSMAFASAGYLFLRILGLGAEGLVWANMINMALRTAWSLTFVNNYFKRNGSGLDVAMMLPQASTIAIGVSTMAILAQVRIGFKGGLEDIIKCGFVSGIFMILM
jgi:oligosaccharide translocation protein RFT1